MHKLFVDRRVSVTYATARSQHCFEHAALVACTMKLQKFKKNRHLRTVGHPVNSKQDVGKTMTNAHVICWLRLKF